jgi:hypothetical protein
MATVLAQALPSAGFAPTLSAATASTGDVVDTGPTVHLVVVSGSTACTLTITTPNASRFGDAVADPTFVIPTNSGTVANGAPFEIPLDTERFGDANGQAALSWSAVTNVKFAVVRR